MTPMRSALAFVRCLFLASVVCSATEVVAMDEGAKDKLMSNLAEFARNNGISEPQLEQLLGTLVLAGPRARQGGVGVIDERTFILLDENQNALVLAGKQWRGKQSNQNEMVVIDGQRVLNPSSIDSIARITIVLFAPTEVRFVDLANSRAGTYPRGIGKKLPQQ